MSVFELLRREPGIRTFSAGETIFLEGEKGEHMFAVLEGEVAIRKGERLLESVGPDGVFGEMALIDHEPRSASATATKPSTVVAIGEKRFLFLVQQTPYFALQLMHILAERLRRNSSS
jgi:CRP/FNR family transcriptional regulator, cyclic AMP receptor protein